MRKIEVMLYEFRELNDAAKEKAIEHFRDFNVDYDWWSNTYDGMAECGIVIREFDTYRGTIWSDIPDKYETAKTVISDIPDKYEKSDFHVLSKQFLLDREALVEKYDEPFILLEDESDLLKSKYHYDLNEVILKMLRDEYEYLTSDEAIIDSIEINEFEFTEDGKIK